LYWKLRSITDFRAGGGGGGRRKEEEEYGTYK